MMKKALLAVALSCAMPAIAFAGTCAAPGTPITQGANAVTGTTCGGDAATFGGGICSGSQAFDPATPVAIYQIEVGATNNFNLVISGAGAAFNPAIALIAPGACGPTAPCYASGNDANGAGQGETLPDGGAMFPENIPAGSYYAAVFSFESGSASCGDFTLTAAPTLPVKLQSFTVG